MRSQRTRFLVAGIALLVLAAIHFPDQVEGELLILLHWPIDQFMIGTLLFVVSGLVLCYLGISSRENTKTT